MGKKKHKPTQSQINGITCIAAILAATLLIIFFSKDNVPTASENDSLQARNIENLKNQEDSVYRSRRPERHDYRRRTLSPHTPPATEQRDFYSTVPPAPTRKPLVVELNDADTTTLMLLHGIGPAFARRIVKYRERLGGFIHKEQLLEVYGFTPALVEHIAPHLTFDSTSLRRLAINQAGLKELIRHPYMDYYFARNLVRLRSQGETFSSPDDLRAIPGADDSLLTKLLPYLDFSIQANP